MILASVEAPRSLFLLVKAVKFALLLGAWRTPEVEVKLGAIRENVRLTLVLVCEPVHPPEPSVNLLSGVPRVHGDVWTSVDNQVMPKHKWHRITASGGRSNRASAKLAPVALRDNGTVKPSAKHRGTVLDYELAKISDDLALTNLGTLCE